MILCISGWLSDDGDFERPWGIEPNTGAGFLACKALADASPVPFATITLAYGAAGITGTCYGCPSLFTVASGSHDVCYHPSDRRVPPATVCPPRQLLCNGNCLKPADRC